MLGVWFSYLRADDGLWHIGTAEKDVELRNNREVSWIVRENVQDIGHHIQLSNSHFHLRGIDTVRVGSCELTSADETNKFPSIADGVLAPPPPPKRKDMLTEVSDLYTQGRRRSYRGEATLNR